MVLLIGSTSVFTMLITIVCFSKTIQRETIKKQQLKWIRGETQYLDEELEKSFYQRFINPLWKKLLLSVSKLNKSGKKGSLKSKERKTRLENELRLAGIRLSPQEFMFLRIVGTAGIMVLGLISTLLLQGDSQVQLLVLLFTMFLIVLIPRYYVKSRIKRRQKAIQNQLPNVLDVLCVSIEAGLGFDAALLKVVEKFKGPLIDEFGQVYREVQMGKPRRESLNAMSQRSSVSELQTFASAVAQSEQFGTPMKNVLHAQAQQLRVNRRQQAQEKGMKAPVKMMLPMVVFIFPVIFIILLGPTIIKVL
ncbi:MAG: type II secretion system F family protein [Christensenellales bacterium]